jgi:hypothetical protein
MKQVEEMYVKALQIGLNSAKIEIRCLKQENTEIKDPHTDTDLEKHEYELLHSIPISIDAALRLRPSEAYTFTHSDLCKLMGETRDIFFVYYAYTFLGDSFSTKNHKGVMVITPKHIITIDNK